MNVGQSAHGASEEEIWQNTLASSTSRPQIQYDDSSALYASPNEPSTSSALVNYDSAEDCVIIDDYEAQFSPVRETRHASKNSPASPSGSLSRDVSNSPVPALLRKLIPIDGVKCQVGALNKKERESKPFVTSTLKIPLLAR